MKRVAITGASGFIGSELTTQLVQQGYSVTRLVRRQPVTAAELYWSPSEQHIDLAGLEGHDIVIHLAGENIAAQRWTPVFKQQILQSRVQGTRLLAQALTRLKNPPRVLVSASAIGYYGNTADAMIDERSPRGSGFLADVCEAWEKASQIAATAGIRLVNARIGVVLSTQGGILAKLLPLFKLGLGGPVGRGQQWLSWIGMADVVNALCYCAENAAISGPVNLTAPQPQTNAEFSKTLAKALHRPAVVYVPEFAIRIAMGSEMAQMVLGGARVYPQVLTHSGFKFAAPTLATWLANLKH